VLLNDVRIEENCLGGAGALSTEGKKFADEVLIVGSPVKAVRELTLEQISSF
jgi:carbonic anhydrase/acetyltransferase-like protein (isoleucine patch superfamily)